MFLATSTFLVTLSLASAATAETRFAVDLGQIAGRAKEVQPVDGTSTLKPTQTPIGFLVRAGAAGRFFETGVMLSAASALLGPSAFAAGLYAGPALGLGSRVRVSIAGELGMQVHDGLGSEFSGDAESSEVSLPYAGVSAALWLNRLPRGASSLSIGLYGEARFDLGHASGKAVVTPSSFCLGILECLLLANSPPQPFTQDYDVGGRAIYVGLLFRLTPRPASAQAPAPDRAPAGRPDATKEPSSLRWR